MRCAFEIGSPGKFEFDLGKISIKVKGAEPTDVIQMLICKPSGAVRR